MPNPAIIFDLDNTIVDTAVRKQKLLQHLNIEGSDNFNKIYEDFELESILGKLDTDKSRNFFNKLDSEESINCHSAPVISAAKEVMCWLAANHYSIYILTGRIEKLRKATLNELKNLDIPIADDNLIMCPEGEDEVSFKRHALEEILDTQKITAVMGDRPPEINSALSLNIPAILFKSTMTEEQITDVFCKNNKEHNPIIVSNWMDAFVQIQTLAREHHQLGDFRSRLIEQYASWLGDIDQKCQIIVAIAAFLCALTGKLILDSKQGNVNEWLLIFAFLFSGLSMIYAIRSFTARYSSGSSASQQILTKPKQWFGIIFNWPKSWVNIVGDPEDDYQKLKNSNTRKKSQIHIHYFIKRYGTTDIDALENLRLFELRAMNHTKVYPERLASRSLMLALGVMLIWMIDKIIPFISIIYTFIEEIITTSIC